MEELLIGLILEGKVEGKIDQVGMRLELDRKFVILMFLPLCQHDLSHLGKVWTRNATQP